MILSFCVPDVILLQGDTPCIDFTGCEFELRLGNVKPVCHCSHLASNLGGYSVRVPPLPIPNREVKPDNADGTA
jgi:hypothetical protein